MGESFCHPQLSCFIEISGVWFEHGKANTAGTTSYRNVLGHFGMVMTANSVGFHFLFQLNLKFQQSFRTASLSISIALNQSPDLSLSTTIGTSSIAFGIESRYKTDSCSFTRYDAGISFTNQSRDASIILAERGDLLRLAYAHHFGQPRKISAVAEVTRRLSKNENPLAVGVSCIVDNLTTAKATLNSWGKLQALLQHKIRPKSSLNISGEIDVKALDKIPRIGLALALML